MLRSATNLQAQVERRVVAYRDVALLNAAASLVIADAAANLRDGLERASQALDSGAAKGTLDRLVKVSNA